MMPALADRDRKLLYGNFKMIVLAALRRRGYVKNAGETVGRARTRIVYSLSPLGCEPLILLANEI